MKHNPNSPFRNRHDDMLQPESLVDRIELINAVASKTGATFDQVLKVYGIESIYRMTETILDAGDAKDDSYDKLKDLIHKEMVDMRSWFYDNQPYSLEVKVKKD